MAVTLGLLLPALFSSFGAAEEIRFQRDIRPLLSNRCFTCHGPDAANRVNDLRLDLPDQLHEPLESGQIPVVPGQPGMSELLTRVSSTDPDLRMPPADAGPPLSASEIGRLEAWITQGAPGAGHWAFQSPVRPALPAVTDRSWPINPIDYFILAELDGAGLRPNPPAVPADQLRRLALSLTGLPPDEAARQRLNSVADPRWYEREVDRLIASPKFGEHRARYWLDAARYGDTHGLHLDNERSIWPYRDWVINALNSNMAFDQFTIAQLAGDLLPEPSPEDLVATGFQRCNVTTSEGGAIDEEFLVRYAVDRVETTATVWLGLTAGCAACHDHKFDPISQREFYQLSAFYFSLTERAMDGNALAPPPTAKAATRLQRRLEREWTEELQRAERELEELRAELTEHREDWIDRVRSSDSSPASAADPDSDSPTTLLTELLQRPQDQRQSGDEELIDQLLLEEFRPTSVNLRECIAKRQTDLQRLAQEIPTTLVMQELKVPRPTYVLKRGEYDQPGEQVEPGVPAVLPPLPGDHRASRLDLARWLVSPRNPLTARVTVNRIWQQYFGTGLVRTPEDFGSQGAVASHPELLDWLAVEFMESGWDLKALHRLIVTSATFRQSGERSAASLEHDPENRLLGRAPRFRLDAEVIRDQALAVSGLLVGEVGGPSVKPYQPAGLWERVAYPTSTTAHFQQDHGSSLYRRSVYTFWKRTAPPPTMQLLDSPTRETCVVRRPRTNSPSAALALMNDVQFVEAARRLAQRLLLQTPDASEDRRIGRLVELVLVRAPEDDELDSWRALLSQAEDYFEEHPDRAGQLLAVGESTADSSIPPAELASWTTLANVLLNLDETLTLP